MRTEAVTARAAGARASASASPQTGATPRLRAATRPDANDFPTRFGQPCQTGEPVACGACCGMCFSALDYCHWNEYGPIPAGRERRVRSAKSRKERRCETEGLATPQVNHGECPHSGGRRAVRQHQRAACEPAEHYPRGPATGVAGGGCGPSPHLLAGRASHRGLRAGRRRQSRLRARAARKIGGAFDGRVRPGVRCVQPSLHAVVLSGLPKV